MPSVRVRTHASRRGGVSCACGAGLSRWWPKACMDVECRVAGARTATMTKGGVGVVMMCASSAAAAEACVAMANAWSRSGASRPPLSEAVLSPFECRVTVEAVRRSERGAREGVSKG